MFIHFKKWNNFKIHLSAKICHDVGYIVLLFPYIMLAAAILLGMYMQEANLPDWCKWVVVAWICFQILIEIILMLWQQYLKYRESKNSNNKYYSMFFI